MTEIERLAAFASRARYEEISPAARRELKLRMLDALGCALGALDAEPVRALGAALAELGGRPHATRIGAERTAPDRAALWNGALVRYLDFNDSYLAPGETCHPSDALGAVLAACELEGGSGRDLLAGLAVAYQVQCRLSDVAPLRDRGFDHATHGAYAAAAGVARALGLDAARSAHALAIAGASLNALRVTRTGALSHWKGLATPWSAAGATLATLLARRGITGPLELLEGKKGFMEAMAGRFAIDWEKEDLERVRDTVLKKHNAEVHSQSTLEAVLELRAEQGLDPAAIERVEVEVFDVAHAIIGGGEEGDKTVVRSKEQADHSLPWLVAVALLDGQVLPEQYRPERIVAPDVQELLRRVRVRPDAELSRRFPAEPGARVEVRLRDGRSFARAKRDHEGSSRRPMGAAAVRRKFELLGRGHAEPTLLAAIADAVDRIEEIAVADLTALLARAGREAGRDAPGG